MSKFDFDFTEKLKEVKDQENKGFEKDSRLWRPVFKDGVCGALIRFLPAPDKTPYIKYQDHSFEYTTPKKEKKKYWKRCRNTLEKNACRICAKSWEYHESKFKSDNKRGMEICRKEHYMTNIYVLKHAARPEDEGKVFLYDMSPVFRQYNQKIAPTETDKQAPDFVQFVPCHFYTGADFFLTSVKNGEFENGTAIPNYAASRFMAQSKFMGGNDDKIEEVFNKTYPLDEFRDDTTYPSDEEIVKLLGHEFGWGDTAEEKGDSIEEDDIPSIFEQVDDAPSFTFDDDPAPTPTQELSVQENLGSNEKDSVVSEDDEEQWFKDNVLNTP